MKQDKSYRDIRHEAKMAEMKKYHPWPDCGGEDLQSDPIQYAKNSLIKSIDTVDEIKAALNDITDSYKYQIRRVQDLIDQYFSDDVQMDESPIAAMRRLQIRKELLEFASKKV